MSVKNSAHTSRKFPQFFMVPMYIDKSLVLYPKRFRTSNMYFNKSAKAIFPALTVFLQKIVSAETILYWIWPYVLWPFVTVHKSGETFQGRKLFKGGNYLKKYGSITNMGLCHLKRNKLWSYLIQRISLTKWEKYPSLFPIASKSIIKKSQN